MKGTILLEGSIWKGILLFSVPIFFSLIFQTLYNTVDTVLIGHFLGDVSLAAMGAVTPLFDLIVGFCSGCGNGFAILVGQSFGARDFEGLRRRVALSLILSFGIGIVLTAFFLVFLPGILNILQTPPEIYSQSLSYISIITMGLLVSVLYNLEAGMLRAIGDSVTPLVILAISSALNILFDWFAIVSLHLGVAGAAYATVLAQFISAMVCLFWIIFYKKELRPSASDFKWDGPLAGALMAQGLSMGLMSSIVSIGSVILQGGINSLGSLIIAAHTAARRVYALLILPLIALMTTISTFVAQNMGANQYDRVVEGIKKSNQADLIYSIAIFILAIFIGGKTIALLSGSTDPVVLQNGELYLLTNSPFFFSLGWLLNLRSSLQGLGKKIIPVVSSIIELASKVVFTIFIIPYTGYLGVCLVEPVCWIIMTVSLSISYIRLPLLREHHVKPRVI